MNYPPTLTVIVPQLRVVEDDNPRAYSNRRVYLTAFALLHVVRHADGRAAFRERVVIDPIGDRTIDLLVQLGAELSSETTIAGWRLDHIVGSLIRLPRDSEREADGKEPLMRLSLALGEVPIDVAWFDDDYGLRALTQAADRHGLSAEWTAPNSSNPAVTRGRLTARARSIWAAIAEKLLEPGNERRKAFASFDQFLSKGGAMD